MRSLWQRFLDTFRPCAETRWCYRCAERVQCQYGRNHSGHLHGHIPDPYGKGHKMEWFIASR